MNCFVLCSHSLIFQVSLLPPPFLIHIFPAIRAQPPTPAQSLQLEWLSLIHPQSEREMSAVKKDNFFQPYVTEELSHSFQVTARLLVFPKPQLMKTSRLRERVVCLYCNHLPAWELMLVRCYGHGEIDFLLISDEIVPTWKMVCFSIVFLS